MGLENIKSLLDSCSIDHRNLPMVHIAGTNGKGSTSRILAKILQKSGYKVGLFTSPHISTFHERIAVNDELITEEELSNGVAYFKKGIEKFHCTFFEASTAIGLKHFLDKKVDIAIIEVGLGGRFDSTNVISPILTAITSISLDHTNFLGHSLIQIAREKAGIMKKDIPIVVNADEKWLWQFFKRSANKHSAPIINCYKRNNIKKYKNKNQLELNIFGEKIKVDFNLLGSYQILNLKTVLSLITILKTKYEYKNISVDTIKKALSSIVIPGRMEFFSKKPDIILDAAHNLAGLKKLEESILSFKEKYKKIHLLFGTVKDKNYNLVIKFLSDIKSIDKLVFSEFIYPRSVKLDKFKKVNQELSKNIQGFATVNEGYQYLSSKMDKNTLLIVTGSHYLLDDFLRCYKK